MSRLNCTLRLLTLVVGIIAHVTFSGCSATHVVNKGEEISFENPVIIEFVNGNKLKVRDIYVLDDQLVAIDRRTREKQYFNLNNIKTLTVSNRKKGACSGLLIGGIGVGTATALLGGTDGMASVAVGFLGGVGALVGAIWGGVRGTNSYYLIELGSTQVHPQDSLSQNEGGLKSIKVEQDKTINYYASKMSLDGTEINTWIRHTFDKHPGQLTEFEQKQAIEILQLAYSQNAKLNAVSDYYFRQFDASQDVKK